MFPQFGPTAASITKASTMVFRIGTDAHLYDDPEDVSIGPLLDSKFDSEKIEALKRLLALIAQGCDVVNFFPQVVKNVASQSLEVKKLVYLYLLHYAEKRPNEALLSINCYQKDLADLNPLVRAWALRAMAGIRLHVVAPLVLAAVGKCARDPSAYVRKCAANALPKLYDLRQEETYGSIEELIGILLNDNSPGVVGAAAAAFNYICPTNLVLIGRGFRRLCEILPDVDEWGQIILIGILLRYAVARYGLPSRSSIGVSSENPSSFSKTISVDVEALPENRFGLTEGQVDDSNFISLLFSSYVEGQDEFLLRSNCTTKTSDFLESPGLSCGENHDVQILLQCTSPLLWSQNSAVVLAAAGVHWIVAPREDIKRIINPILFLLRSANSSLYVVLCNLLVFAKAMPSLFAPYFKNFFVHSSDSYHIRAMKLEILSIIATDSSIPLIFQEFQDYLKDPDRRFVADTVHVIGECAQRLPKVSATCLEGLLSLIRQESSENIMNVEEEGDVLSQAVVALKTIVKDNPAKHEKVIIRLARCLDIIKVPAARALIVWMIGEYCTVGHDILRTIPVILQYLAQHFSSENMETKQQILNTAAKIKHLPVCCWLPPDATGCRRRSPEVVAVARHCRTVLPRKSSRCDLNYDVRDRARIVSKLLACHVDSQNAEGGRTHPVLNRSLHYELAESMLGRKVKPISHVPACSRFYLPGSLSHIVLHAAPGYESLPKPCSLANVDLHCSLEHLHEEKVTGDKCNSPGSSDTENGSSDSDSFSGSSEKERSDYDSQGPDSNESEGAASVDSGRGNRNSRLLLTDVKDMQTSGALIHFSDVDVEYNELNQAADGNGSSSSHLNVSELLSKEKLESWLGQQQSMSEPRCPAEGISLPSSARITIRETDLTIKPKVHKLLDPTSGNGLGVEYFFSSELSDANSDARDSSNGGNSLSSSCGKKHPAKLRPDVGYFIKPLILDLKTFVDKESQLPGMFEYTRRCTFTGHIGDLHSERLDGSASSDKVLVVAQRLASEILSNANISLVAVTIPVSVTDAHMRDVDDVSGLCLRFGCEISSSSIPCLLTVTVEGRYSGPLTVVLRINCEESIFGLNLLNRIGAVFA
ncbi:AP3-complex subunit beta-A [Nymphaea thermarum]|nr:AP3-complex subunit beta-A [Nymphaea thermarum]